MTSIKQSNAMFRKARHQGSKKVDAKEAKQIAGALKKGGLSATERKAVAAQLLLYKDTFSAGAAKALKALTNTAAPSAPATQGSSAAATAAPSTPDRNVQIPSKGGTIEDKAAAALGQLEEPKFPGKDATEAELAQFQKDLGKYNRMYEMMSKVMANSHEMKKSVIGNIPR